MTVQVFLVNDGSKRGAVFARSAATKQSRAIEYLARSFEPTLIAGA
jgi:hypothetical protein